MITDLRLKAAGLLAVLCFAAVPAQAVIIDKIAVIVNENVITQSEIHAIEGLKLNLSGLPAQKSILWERIDHHLLLQQLAKQPPQEVPDEKIQEVINSYAQQHGGMEELLLFLHSIGLNYADFEREVREQLSIQRFITDRFRPFVNITIDDAEKYYNEVYKPEREKEGLAVPPLPEVFGDIQDVLVKTQMEDRISQWLQELRKSASIYVKN